jgi:hypothetical protein
MTTTPSACSRWDCRGIDDNAHSARERRTQRERASEAHHLARPMLFDWVIVGLLGSYIIADTLGWFGWASSTSEDMEKEQ